MRRVGIFQFNDVCTKYWLLQVAAHCRFSVAQPEIFYGAPNRTKALGDEGDLQVLRRGYVGATTRVCGSYDEGMNRLQRALSSKLNCKNRFELNDTSSTSCDWRKWDALNLSATMTHRLLSCCERLGILRTPASLSWIQSLGTGFMGHDLCVKEIKMKNGEERREIYEKICFTQKKSGCDQSILKWILVLS